jgi:hypothetical protein
MVVSLFRLRPSVSGRGAGQTRRTGCHVWPVRDRARDRTVDARTDSPVVDRHHAAAETTPGDEGICTRRPVRSITFLWREGLERATGIEPVSLAWKARVLPLHNARALHCLCDGSSGVKQDLDRIVINGLEWQGSAGFGLGRQPIVYRWPGGFMHHYSLLDSPRARRQPTPSPIPSSSPGPPNGSAIIATGLPSTTTCPESPAPRRPL